MSRGIQTGGGSVLCVDLFWSVLTTFSLPVKWLPSCDILLMFEMVGYVYIVIGLNNILNK